MRSIVSLTTVASLLLHLWLGCCAHHGHSVAACACTGDAEEANCVEGDCECESSENAGAAEIGGTAPHEQPVPTNGCTENECVFVSVLKVTAPIDFDSAASQPVAILSDEGVSLSSSARGRADELQPAPPLRRHLLQRVLLI